MGITPKNNMWTCDSCGAKQMNGENGCTCSGKPKLWWIERFQEFFFMRDGRPTPDLVAIVKEAERLVLSKLAGDVVIGLSVGVNNTDGGEFAKGVRWAQARILADIERLAK